MTALLAGIEQSAFSIWVRESGSVWSYPTIIFLHTVGLALLVGINVALDLRLAGMMPELPLAPFARLFRIMWAGFWINVVTGLVLLASNATTTLAAPAFYVKMACIAAAVALFVFTRRQVFDRGDLDTAPLPSNARLLAWLSMACWLGAITAGRLMTYFAAVPELTSRIGG